MIHPRTLSRHASQAGNTFIVVMIFVAIFAIMLGAAFVYTDETARQGMRAARFVPIQQAADAALDVVYGRFSRWVNAHTGLTPSIRDAQTAGLPSDASFPAITGSISFAGCNGLSDYQVSSLSLVPLLPDDEQGTDFPNWSTWAASPAAYQAVVNKYLLNTANLYEPTIYANAIVYLATVTITPNTVDSLHPGPLTVSRYIHASQVSPFAYNVFTEGAFEDYNFGQTTDSEASIYASTTIKMDFSGTVINGPMRYGTGFIDPTGKLGGTSNLVFQDPDTGATVDPFTSGLLKQVSKIEVVPDLSDIIAHNPDGTRSASAETAPATADDFSRREIIEPPANIAGGDTAPSQVSQRRIYSQADSRIGVTVSTRSVTIFGKTSSSTTATATFYNPNGSVLAQYQGTPNNATSTSWTLTQGSASANSLQTTIINALTINLVNSNAPFYDSSRTYDGTANYNNLPGQPTSSNYGNAIETVDVNVGTLTTLINANPSAFPNGIVYVWNDGADGQKNGVRLWNGGVLPNEGLTIGSTNPVYIKGDYNTGTQLTNPSDINSTPVAATLPSADTVGYDNGVSLPESARLATGYTQKPSGVFGDSVTTLSQNWRDASSASTQYAASTTYNTVMGFGSGDSDSLLPDDSFSTGQYSFVQSLEMWNNARWSQGGEQMSLYHSIYNRHRSPPAWLNNGWAVIDPNFDAVTARVPLQWGYLVFNRGRYLRN